MSSLVDDVVQGSGRLLAGAVYVLVVALVMWLGGAAVVWLLEGIMVGPAEVTAGMGSAARCAKGVIIVIAFVAGVGGD